MVGTKKKIEEEKGETKQPEEPRKVTSRAGTSEKSEWFCTVRLFGTNSLKEGASFKNC
jgi:hypothetical protein